jgi:hypothetical protein
MYWSSANVYIVSMSNAGGMRNGRRQERRPDEAVGMRNWRRQGWRFRVRPLRAGQHQGWRLGMDMSCSAELRYLFTDGSGGDLLRSRFGLPPGPWHPSSRGRRPHHLCLEVLIRVDDGLTSGQSTPSAWLMGPPSRTPESLPPGPRCPSSGSKVRRNITSSVKCYNFGYRSRGEKSVQGPRPGISLP